MDTKQINNEIRTTAGALSRMVENHWHDVGRLNDLMSAYTVPRIVRDKAQEIAETLRKLDDQTGEFAELMEYISPYEGIGA